MGKIDFKDFFISRDLFDRNWKSTRNRRSS